MLDLLDLGTEVEGILRKALEGERITEGEALRLLKAQGDDLLATLMVANKIRREKVGDVVTYVVNRNINFTNVCTGSCLFCGFRRERGEPDSYLLTVDQVLEKVREAMKVGATEVCIQGGLHPDLDISFYTSLLRAIKREAKVHIHAFSPMEVYYAAQRSGLKVKEALQCLKEAGLDSMPGTAAEILDDGVRAVICPEKMRTRDWVGVVREAHRLAIPTTATMLYGHVEGPDEQVEHLRVLRELQDETGGFTEFVPLSFVHFNTPLYLAGGLKEGATGTEDLRIFAVSRIYLDNFRNLQASWVKLGRKFAQVMLSFGANDLGGTLMEENISRSAGLSPAMLTQEEIVRMIKEAGKIPRQRGTLYDVIESPVNSSRIH